MWQAQIVTCIISCLVDKAVSALIIMVYNGAVQLMSVMRAVVLRTTPDVSPASAVELYKPFRDTPASTLVYVMLLVAGLVLMVSHNARQKRRFARLCYEMPQAQQRTPQDPASAKLQAYKAAIDACQERLFESVFAG
jgi:hypothetical protein